MEKQSTSPASTSDKATLLNGCQFSFEYANSNIELWMSNITGEEVVQVDGAEASRARSWRKVSSHTFVVAEKRLHLTLVVHSLIKGHIYCVLSEIHGDTTQPIFAKQLIAWPSKTTKQVTTERKKSWRAKLWSIIQCGFAFAVGIYFARQFDLLSWQFVTGILTVAVIAGGVEHVVQKYTKRRQGSHASTEATKLDDGFEIEELALTDLPSAVLLKVQAQLDAR